MPEIIFSKLSWKEYLQNDSSPNSFLLKNIFVKCDIFINFLSKFSSLDKEPPELRIIKDNRKQAGHKNGKIYIYEGLIEQFQNNEENDYIHLHKGISLFFLYWVVAHEFFHYSQQHSKIKEKLGDSYNKALEFDADRLALGALYEFFLSSAPLEKLKYDVKKSFLICLFYPIRHKIKSENYVVFEDATHPFWMLRLYYMLTELATFGNSGALSIESINDQIRLTKVLNNLENDYKNNNLYSVDQTDLKYYLINHSVSDFKKLMDEFEVIRPLL